jgi:hypothetical protein
MDVAPDDHTYFIGGIQQGTPADVIVPLLSENFCER